MVRPKVTLSNYSAVYDYYRSFRPNRVINTVASALFAVILRPRIEIDPRTSAQLKAVGAGERSAIFVINHLSGWDFATAWALPFMTPVRSKIGRAHALAKDSLFRGGLRFFADNLGGIPVFRSKNYGHGVTGAAHRMLTALCVDLLTRGDIIVIFPEGTFNRVDPTKVQELGTAAAQIALALKDRGVDPLVIPVGVCYGPKSRVRNASIFAGAPIQGLPASMVELTILVRERMQAAVDAATARYEM